MQVKSLPRRAPKYAEGGMVEGPPHEQGGVAAVDGSGEQIAEVEGGERIFSTEDTQQMEQVAMQIMELQQSNPTAADQLARELGFMVVEMIMKQEQNQQMQEAGMGAEQGMGEMDQAANSFAMSEE